MRRRREARHNVRHSSQEKQKIGLTFMHQWGLSGSKRHMYDSARQFESQVPLFICRPKRPLLLWQHRKKNSKTIRVQIALTCVKVINRLAKEEYNFPRHLVRKKKSEDCPSDEYAVYQDMKFCTRNTSTMLPFDGGAAKFKLYKQEYRKSNGVRVGISCTYRSESVGSTWLWANFHLYCRKRACIS